MKRLLLVSMLLSVAFPAFAEPQFTSTKEVTVTGVADMAAGEAAARDAAIRNAQRNAVESVLGTYISSSFSDEQQEIAHNADSTFSSKVQQVILTKSAGFIEKQTVVNESHDAQTYHVTLTVDVRLHSMQQELDGLRDLLKSANYPKVIVLVGERYTDGKGQVHPIDRPAVVPALEEILLKKTFELVTRANIELSPTATLSSTDGQLADMGQKAGADVVIAGVSDAKFSAFNEFNDNMYYLSALVSLRAINTHNGKVLASFETVGKSAGVSEDLARVKAVGQATPEVADKLLEGLVRSWKQESTNGQRYHIVVSKVRNYAKVGRPFMKALQKLTNVTQVNELGFKGTTLTLEITYRGTKGQLLDGILDDVSRDKLFRHLNKTGDGPDQIDLSL